MFDEFDVTAYALNAKFQLTSMTIMWIICVLRKNGSMVDFGWPLGFTSMAIWYLLNGTGGFKHRFLICGLYIVAGFRFMFGWAVGRRHWQREDHRFAHWREHWKENGLFGIKSDAFNFFWYYHMQSTTNLLILSIPLHILATESSPYFNKLEYFGLFLWVFGFVFENIADLQLAQYKKTKPGPVMKTGLWRYSRHPNYFGEFLLWVAYLIMCLPSAKKAWHFLGLFLLPITAYYYLVHFTGAFMAEKVSLKKRGEPYAQYQRETSILIPWFPKSNKKVE